MNILSIDIGGTSIKSDIYSEKGISQNAFQEMPTRIDHQAGTNGILDQVKELIACYLLDWYLNGVAISSAGVIDPISGIVVYSGYTIPGYTGINFKEEIQSCFDLCCSIENDVNCAALGEYWLGAGEGSRSLVCLTIGTGIGGAILMDGEPWRGHSHSAGEVGYMKVQGGNWQDVASTTALCKHYEQLTGLTDIDGKMILSDYRSGGSAAAVALSTFIDHFCEGLLSIIYLCNPERIVLGGGIMKQSNLMLPKIEAKLAVMIESPFFLPISILPAQFGNEAGRVGAVKKFLKEYVVDTPTAHFRGISG